MSFSATANETIANRHAKKCLSATCAIFSACTQTCKRRLQTAQSICLRLPNGYIFSVALIVLKPGKVN